MEKKKINGKLLNEVINYNEMITNKYNKYISNLNELLKNFNQNEEIVNDKNIPQTIKELLNNLNQCHIYEANIGILSNDKTEVININELKEIVDKLKGSVQNKKEMMIGLIPKIFESYNILVKEGIKADNQIKYYNYKKQILIDKKNANDDLDKLINEYTNLKNTISLLKEKYNNMKEDFLLIKEKLSYNENIYNNLLEKEMVNMLKNQNENKSEEEKNENLSLEETNDDEEDESYKEILKEINTLKNNITNKKNILLKSIEKEKEDSTNIGKILDKCKNSDFQFIEIEKSINSLISSRYSIEQNISDLKLNYLILNTLPSQYETYKIFISHEALKEKNQKLEKKLKLVFGVNFNINYIYNDETPEIIWRQEEIPKLTSDIMILREEKNQLENDYNALKAAFDLALKGNGNDNNHLILLFKIKEENKKLKKEIHLIKEKNIKLEEKLKELNYNNNEALNTNNKNLKINDFIGISNSLNGNSILSINDIGNNHNINVSNINNNVCSNHNKNSNTNNKVIKEYKKNNNNLKQKLLYSDTKNNSSFLNGAKDYCSDYKSKSKKKFTNVEK